MRPMRLYAPELPGQMADGCPIFFTAADLMVQTAAKTGSIGRHWPIGPLTGAARLPGSCEFGSLTKHFSPSGGQGRGRGVGGKVRYA